jgi:hypothetical protein
MNRAELLEFLRRHRYAVQASSAHGGAPQAAVIGIAVTDELELVFERFPDAPEREAWPELTYFRVRPSWARYSDFRAGSVVVEVPL